jgi:PrtD family type I secretion system ABC transporter
LRELIKRFRPFFIYAGLFSLVLNMLMLAPALYMLQIFDRVISSRSEETLIMLSIVVVVALVMMTMLETIRARLLMVCGQALDRKLGPSVLAGLMTRTARLTGAEYQAGLRDVASLRGFLTGAGIMALFDAPWLPFFLILIFLFHPVMCIVAIAGAAMMIGLAWANERATRKPIERMQQKTRVASRFVDASVRNAEVVSALGMLPAVTRRWAKLNDEVLEYQAEATGLGGSIAGLTRFMRQFLQIAMVGTGAYLVVHQHVTPGIMLAATLILGRALAPVERLVATWKDIAEARAAFRRLEELTEGRLAEEPGVELPAPKGVLHVERAMFTLKGNERPLIRGVSFAVQAGEHLGMIGPSAAGKSTLARLIVGVWQPVSGTVRLDGADVATWPREHLGPHIGYLPQDVELFSGTVAENIARLGEVDSPAVIRAAQRAHVHEMILRLPKGYDTEAGEGGSALSPGQRQRIALARALYGEPRLVVLDEPNANLDHDGDEALVRALRELKQAGVTVVIIAHRPSLLGTADKLLVMKDGAVEMFGPRAEVLARFTRAAPQVKGVA